MNLFKKFLTFNTFVYIALSKRYTDKQLYIHYTYMLKN